MKKESLFQKIKGSIKAVSYVFQVLMSVVFLIIKGITFKEYLAFNLAMYGTFCGIREYGKRFRPPINIGNQND